ncbi:MAG: RNase adapter RapZ [Candidatus Limnocylindrus sp.]
MTTDRRVILLTGLSGAGKTTATKSLEDIGFRTIDNLPHELLPALVEKIAADPQRFARVCLVLDARDGDPSHTIELVRTGAATIGVSARIIYLDARDDVLIRRFSETRRRHPLGGAVDAPRSVADAIAAERTLLSATRESADAVIDTSDLSGRELRDRLVAEALESDGRVAIRLTSFGYKHGIPLEADLVFDVRAAANPHWVPELRPLDGRSQEISDYVLRDPTGAALMKSIELYLAASAASYLADGRGRLSIAIGCTGGRHRSVAIVEALARRLPAIVGSAPIVGEQRDLARS